MELITIDIPMAKSKIHLIAIQTKPHHWVITSSDSDMVQEHAKEAAPSQAYLQQRALAQWYETQKKEIERPDKLIKKMRESGRERGENATK